METNQTMRTVRMVIGTLISLTCGSIHSQALNTLTPEEKSQGFVLMFDGTMQSVRDNFVAYQKDGTNVTTLPANIEVPASGEYFWDNNATQDIRSKKMYDDFELKFEYRISDNAGLYYRANLITASIYQNAIEYQLYDGTPEPGDWNAPAAAYDIYPPLVPNYKHFATNEWNSVRVRLYKDSVYHWHNDALEARFSMLSSDYKARLVAHKWANVPCIGVQAASESQCDHNNPYRTTGYIGLQTGYPGQLYVRNMKVAKYPFPPPTSLRPGAASAAGLELSAVPAPMHGLEIRVEAGAAFDVEIYAPDGKAVKRFQGAAGANRFNYSAAGPGLYVIQATAKGDHSRTGRIVRKAVIE